VGERATYKYYLEPMFAAEAAISALHQRLEGVLLPEERQNVVVALDVLAQSKEQVRDILNYVRVNQAKRSAEDYVRIRRESGCRPTPYVAEIPTIARSFQ